MLVRILLGALVATTLTAAIECYVLLGRAQLLLTFSEQLLTAARGILAHIPGKTAPPVETIRLNRWWEWLHEQPPPAPRADGRPRPTPYPRPRPGPAATGTRMQPDEVDARLARFDFSGRNHG
jgi:hypothetical protein